MYITSWVDFPTEDASCRFAKCGCSQSGLSLEYSTRRLYPSAEYRIESVSMADISTLIEAYSCGAELLREAVLSTPEFSWDVAPIDGKWSIRQVVCHLADGEIVYADRMKRVIAEENPTLFEADPDLLVPALYCSQRPWEAELNVVDAVRTHMLSILQSCVIEDFQRTGVHSTDGPMTLRTLLERITGHIPHHIAFIEEKLQALGIRKGAEQLDD